MQAKRILDYVPDPSKFDLVTHRWDSQGQQVINNPYRMFIRDGNKLFERPVNSGNLWFETNQPAGRIECTFNDKGHIIEKRFDDKAEHKTYSAPLKGMEKAHYELEQQRARNAELEAELAAIKGDRKPKHSDDEKAAPTHSKRG